MNPSTQHTLVALLEDRPGALNRVVSLFRRRGFNIDSLSVGHTEAPGISRLTVVVDGATTIVEQVVKQLYKVLDVVKVSDITHDESVERELALIKVAATASTRSDIMQMCDIFRAKIVDVAPDSVIVEVTGQTDKVDSLFSLLRPFGIKEMVRTGRVAMVRGLTGVTRLEEPAQLQKYKVLQRAGASYRSSANDI
ncbi:MAG: acetolactate synthase small subunit [Chloroflexi bacterium]|nr:acetolactate synthase small subunit [Chloroflexota bacterium]